MKILFYGLKSCFHILKDGLITYPNPFHLMYLKHGLIEQAPLKFFLGSPPVNTIVIFTIDHELLKTFCAFSIYSNKWLFTLLSKVPWFVTIGILVSSFQVKQPLSSLFFERLSSACSQILRLATQSALPHLPWFASLLGRVQVRKS